MALALASSLLGSQGSVASLATWCNEQFAENGLECKPLSEEESLPVLQAGQGFFQQRGI